MQLTLGACVSKGYSSWSCLFLFFTHAAFIDYTPVDGREIVFTSGQTVNGVQCMSVALLDDSNVLENPETFTVVLSRMDSFVEIRPGQEDIIINVNEDPTDG